MRDARSHPAGYGLTDTDSIVQRAARLVAVEQNVSVPTALRQILSQAFESGRYLVDVARDISGGPEISEDISP